MLGESINDKEPAEEDLQENSSLNAVPNEQCDEEKEHDKAVPSRKSNDKEPAEEDLQENSSLNVVPNEQCDEEKELDKAVPSRKKNNRGKTHKRNKLSEKNKETNIVSADDAPKVKRVRKKSSTAPCLDQSQQAKNPSEAEETNLLQSPYQSQLSLGTQTTAGSPEIAEEPASVAAEDIDCDKGVGKEVGENPEVDETDKRETRKLSSLQHDDIVQWLGNSLLGRGPLIVSDSEDESRTNTPLPVKFSFEDETPVVEKTEAEKELEALFAEGFPLEVSTELPEVNSERECSPADDSPEARCARGEHETYQTDDRGVLCIRCGGEVLGRRDVLPLHWAKPKPKPAKKRLLPRTDELPKFADKRHVKRPSVKTAAAFACPDDGTVWDIEPCVRKMFIHQQEGFEFLWRNLAGSTDIAELKNMDKPNEVGGCIISHAPGTGKTRLSIVFLQTYLTVFPDSRPVIIAPAGMLLTWKEELEKWDFPFPVHDLSKHELTDDERKNAPKSVAVHKGNKTNIVRTVKLYLWGKRASVLVISYPLFERLTRKKKSEESDAEILRDILLEKPGLVIMDEGHTARNESSKLWNALSKLKTDKRVILSGTPFQNNFRELFNTLKLVRPAVAKDETLLRISKSKKRKHNQSVPISETIDGADLEKLKNVMLPFVNVHKPAKSTGLGESVIFLKPPKLQDRLIKTLEGTNKLGFDHKVTLTSVHPSLLLDCEKKEWGNLDSHMESVLGASKLNPNEGAKTKFIIELFRLSLAANEKVLIFSQFIPPLKLIKDQLKVVFQWVEGKQILHMKGEHDLNFRQDLIKSFNDPSSEATVMLASIKCCSEGISLVGASRVVLLDAVWNPSVKRQAICRAYRIGQTKFVHAYHLLTSGTTEGDKYGKQIDKERISELVFCSPNGEGDKGKKQATGGIEKDTILEQMAASATLADMFDKIIYQDPDSN